MQALERTVKVTDVYLARLSIYVEKDVSGLGGTGGMTGGGSKVESFLPSFLGLLQSGGAKGAGAVRGSWAEEEAEVNICVYDGLRTQVCVC